jgi:TPR repeat protein
MDEGGNALIGTAGPTPQDLRPGPALYPRVYHASPRWLAFCGGLGLVALVASLVGLGFGAAHYTDAPGIGAIVLVVSVCLGFAALGAYMIADTLASTIILDTDRIEYRHLFRRQRIRLDEIAGRKIQRTGNGPATLILVPRDVGTKKFKIPCVHRTDAVFDDWLKQLPDLDVIDAKRAQEELQRSEAEIAIAPEFGRTPAQRLARLALARKLAKALHVAVIVLYVWAMVDPRPYTLVIALLAAMPWLAVVLVVGTRGLFRIDVPRNDGHPNLIHLAMLPGLVLGLRAFLDVDLVAWTDTLIPAAFGCVTLVVAFAAADRGLRQRLAALLVLVPFAAAYAEAAIILGNALLDRSPAEIIRVAVQDKHVESGKRTMWYLRLAPWGSRLEADDIKVAKGLYAAVAPGQIVCLHLRQGALKIGWFWAATCPAAPPPPSGGVKTPNIAALRSQADQGDANAQYSLGAIYWTGAGVPQDDVEAARWFRLSETSVAQSASILGYMYDVGCGVPQDFAEARRHYEIAAEKGELVAELNLAFMYTVGRGGPADNERGFHWFMEAAKRGDPRGMNGVGYSYLTGAGVERDSTKAVDWLRAAAEAGQPNAMHSLGTIFLKGENAPQDVEAAYRWLSLAVRTYTLSDPKLPSARTALTQASSLLSAAQRSAIEASIAGWKPSPGRPAYADEPSLR